MSGSKLDLPGPGDPSPRWKPVALSAPRLGRVVVRDDRFSDRIRCDHPGVKEGEPLGRALLREADARSRSRVVVLCRRAPVSGLERAGFWLEAEVPRFYQGQESCFFLGGAPGPDPALRDPETVARVERIAAAYPSWVEPPAVTTERATAADAPAIAALVARNIRYYPTPTGHPGYVERSIRGGTPFRLVRDGGRVVACASADLDRDTLAAELTDCFTAPSHRRRGLMRALLRDLLHDLEELGYATAFTLCRATSPGINLAFKGLGFRLDGTMRRSCRIGESIEDMNVWSRAVRSRV
jgi:putative beta-lysine N-acetyltransferase